VGLLEHVAVQRCVLVSYGLLHMLIRVPNLVFLSMLPPLVTVSFDSSQQLVCGSASSARGRGRRAGMRGRGAAVRGTDERSRERAGCGEEEKGML
jgi:hypothetical protein